MRRVTTAGGARLPVLGLGTWRMGEDRRRRAAEVAALRLGIDLGMEMIDTAEMYGDGGAEEVVGEAIAGRRDQVFLVTKVLPRHASREGTLRAADRSLRRLRTDRIDLYLLHWPGPVPMAETLGAFEALRAAGKVLHYGLSNVDVEAMERCAALPGGEQVAADQVLYNLARRGVERRLLPWCARRGAALMAYSPLDQGGLRLRRPLRAIAAGRGVPPQVVALAWVLRRPPVVAIPKAVDPEHVRWNALAAELTLEAEELETLDRAYPVPDSDVPLETA
jgi:diketogulonate reductase-like aldo/keto reductase